MPTTQNEFFYITTLIVSLAALGLSGYNWWQTRSLNYLKKTFFAGATGADLEDVLNTVAAQIANVKDEQMLLEQNFLALQHNFGFAVQKIGVVRFNPFADGGGNLSFALALLDGHNTGVVVTSMHGREQNRIYTKRITQGESDVQLTEEEQQAIQNANNAQS